MTETEMMERVLNQRPYWAWSVEGGRIGAVACALCGAMLLIEAGTDHVRVHAAWHLLMAQDDVVS